MKLAQLTTLHALVAVRNKDTEEDLHLLIPYDESEATRLEDRAKQLVAHNGPPSAISIDPDFYKCKFCDQRSVCFGMADPELSCRTCEHVRPVVGGAFMCALTTIELSVQEQQQACEHYAVNKFIVPTKKVLGWTK